MPYTRNAETPSVTRRSERRVRGEGVSLIGRARNVAAIDTVKRRRECVAHGPIGPPAEVPRDQQLRSTREAARRRDANTIPVDLRKDLDRRPRAHETRPR